MGWAVLPALALGVAALLVGPGASGRFQAALTGMIAAVILGAFGVSGSWREALVRVPAAAVLAGGLHALWTGDPGAALALGFLFLAVATAAGGLAMLGRRLGTPSLPAGAVAACVLWVAMGGVFWADPVAEHLGRRQRRPFRQAVLFVDPALALAYDGARFDRLRSPEVYFRVPLASSVYERPEAVSTGALWFGTGLVAWGAALGLGAIGRRRRRAQ